MDMVEFIQGLNVKFEEEDRDCCKWAVEKICDLAEMARRNGTLIFDDLAQSEKNELLKTAMTMIADCHCTDDIRETLQLMILGTRSDRILLEGVALFQDLLLTEGILGIANGDNPRIIRDHLIAMLGEKHVLRADEIEEEDRRKQKIVSDFWDELERQKAKEELPEFESLIIRMYHNYIRKVMGEIPDIRFATALKGVTNQDVWRSLFITLSQNRKVRLIETINNLPDVSDADIESAQAEIVEYIKELNKKNHGIYWKN